MMDEKDNLKQPYAEWLNEALMGIMELGPENIGIVAIAGTGECATTYYHCNASTVAQMAAVLQQDGMMMRIESNPEWLREIIAEGEKK